MITFDLNEKQKAAFKKLKSAYKACEKAGIYFVNNYAELQAYDSSIVAGYANEDTYDKNDCDVISTRENIYVKNNMNIAHQWTDDEHLIKLTPKGKKMLDNDEL